jgi:hypothetical protein
MGFSGAMLAALAFAPETGGVTTENSVRLDLTQAITQRAGFWEPSRGGFLMLPHGLVHPEESN